MDIDVQRLAETYEQDFLATYLLGGFTDNNGIFHGPLPALREPDLSRELFRQIARNALIVAGNVNRPQPDFMTRPDRRFFWLDRTVDPDALSMRGMTITDEELDALFARYQALHRPSPEEIPAREEHLLTAMRAIQKVMADHLLGGHVILVSDTESKSRLILPETRADRRDPRALARTAYAVVAHARKAIREAYLAFHRRTGRLFLGPPEAE